MAQRLIFKTQNQFFYTNETTVADINITPTKITFKLVSNYQAYPSVIEDGQESQLMNFSEEVYNFEIDLETFKSASIETNTLYGVNIHYNEKNIITPRSFVNVSELTKVLKLKSSFSAKLSYGNSIPPFLQILVKDPNGTFEDWDILFFSNKNIVVNSNNTFTDTDNSTFLITSILDPISVERDNTYSNEQYVQYIVNAPEYAGVVFLEPVTGIVNKTRLDIDNTGKGTFKVLKSSYEADGISVKLGYRSYIRLVTFTDTL